MTQTPICVGQASNVDISSEFDSASSPKPPHSPGAIITPPRSASDYDDSMSSWTLSTLPPSYRTDQSTQEFRRPTLPSSFSDREAEVPPALLVPPSAYERYFRNPQPLKGWSSMIDSQVVEVNRNGLSLSEDGGGRAVVDRIGAERKRSQDGGVHLGGWRPGFPQMEQGDGCEAESGPTRPPSYFEVCKYDS